jgi:hypothetical protein
MIIVAAPSDEQIKQTARDQSYNFPDIYGETFIMGGDVAMPRLGHNEKLFIIGHGVDKGDSGVAEIGEASGAFAVNGLDLWESIKEIFPDMYHGAVYVDACKSADFVPDNFSFIEVLRSQVDVAFDGVEVFGRFGDVGGEIPRPTSTDWTRA